MRGWFRQRTCGVRVLPPAPRDARFPPSLMLTSRVSEDSAPSGEYGADLHVQEQDDESRKGEEVTKDRI